MADYKNIIPSNNLGANFSAVLPYQVGADFRWTLGINIDNGAGAAPSDAPVGTWQLQIYLGGSQWFRVFDADAQLAMLAPSGNAVVNGAITFRGVPGKQHRLAYVRTSGGGSSSICSAWTEQVRERMNSFG